MKNKIAWGIIGAGGIADRRTLPGMLLSENSYPAAVMEIDEQRAKEIALKYGAKSYYTSVEGLLADENVEAVYIASPVMFHKEQILAAIKADKHILCEKPLCLTAEESYKMAEECRKAGLYAASGFMMRYHSLHIKMKELIKEGRIGDIVSCRAQMNCWFPEIEGSWRQDRAKTGGGALIDMGIHCIDILEYITGSVCTEVFGFCDTKTFSYNIDDSANVVLKMSNKAVAYVDVNYNIPDNACPCRLEILGTKGSLIAEGTIGQEDTGVLRCVFSEQGKYDANQVRKDVQRIEYAAEGVNLYEREISSFTDSIIAGSEVKVPMECAAHVQRSIEAAYKSSETGSVVRIVS